MNMYIVLALLFLSNLSSVLGQCGRSRRRSWRSLSCQERIEFLRAVQILKDQGIYDEFVQVHWDSGEWSHEVPAFFPWHRWYLHVFEKELQRVSNSCMTVPYWDWDRGDSLEVMLKMWTFGTRNRGGCVENGVARHWEPVNGERCLVRVYDESWSIATNAEVLSRITNFRDFDIFAEGLEGAPHAAVHEFIGGPMAINWSPDDPLFWLHHSQVDRLFTLWQDYWDHDLIQDPRQFRWTHYSGSDIDQPLRFRQGSLVNFNAPGRNRPPTPRELLNGVNGLVQVRYVNDALARLLMESSLSYRSGGNNRNWIVPARGRVRDRCPGLPIITVEEEEEVTVVVVKDPVAPVPGAVEAQVCYDRGFSCQTDDDCCSNVCNDFGRCEEAVPTIEENTGEFCTVSGEQCEIASECCSGYCSFREAICKDRCYARGSRCDANDACCSGHCNRFRRCESNHDRSRDLVAVETLRKDEPLEFPNSWMKERWYELIADYPDNPARLWDILAGEDCEKRAKEANHEIRSASKRWMETMFKSNNTRVFDCHYI